MIYHNFKEEWCGIIAYKLALQKEPVSRGEMCLRYKALIAN